jgi:hypothetical protein
MVQAGGARRRGVIIFFNPDDASVLAELLP